MSCCLYRVVLEERPCVRVLTSAASAVWQNRPVWGFGRLFLDEVHGQKSAPRPTPYLDDKVSVFMTSGDRNPRYIRRHWVARDLLRATSHTNNTREPLMRRKAEVTGTNQRTDQLTKQKLSKQVHIPLAGLDIAASEMDNGSTLPFTAASTWTVTLKDGDGASSGSRNRP